MVDRRGSLQPFPPPPVVLAAPAVVFFIQGPASAASVDLERGCDVSPGERIDDFIVSARFEDVTFNGVFADEAVIPINGGKATIDGLELGYQHALTGLPAPFDGVVLGLNYTYTDAEGDVEGRRIPLPAASRNTFNAMLGYEKGPMSFRLAATYRDRYLDELADEPEEDRYVKEHLQVDFSIRYRLNDRLQLFADFINLGDEPYVAYQRGPRGDRLLQYEEYSWTGKLGVRASF